MYWPLVKLKQDGSKRGTIAGEWFKHAPTKFSLYFVRMCVDIANRNDLDHDGVITWGNSVCERNPPVACVLLSQRESGVGIRFFVIFWINRRFGGSFRRHDAHATPLQSWHRNAMMLCFDVLADLNIMFIECAHDHYSDAKWPSWRLELPVNRVFVQPFVQTNNKDLRSCPIVMGFHRWQVDPLTKGRQRGKRSNLMTS